jgi:hypothetical protein
MRRSSSVALAFRRSGKHQRAFLEEKLPRKYWKKKANAESKENVGLIISAALYTTAYLSVIRQGISFFADFWSILRYNLRPRYFQVVLLWRWHPARRRCSRVALRHTHPCTLLLGALTFAQQRFSRRGRRKHSAVRIRRAASRRD